MQENDSPNIVVVGGGTGSFTLLSSLKYYVKEITALVNMADDGGSTGALRDELGVLPPGDVRQCLVALSDSTKVRDLFNYRFDEGTFKGHSFGNLFLSTVEKMTNNFEEAVQIASEALQIHGKVIPVTTDNAQLVLRESNGHEIRGEHKIGHLRLLGERRPHIYLEPEATLTQSGKEAIKCADMVVIAPGNLYGSLAPALVIKGIKEALQKTSAKIIYVCNLVTKPHQTDGFMVHDYASEIERFIGAGVLDYVIYNTDEPTSHLMEKYIHAGEKIIEFDLEVLEGMHYKSIGLPLIAQEIVKPVKGDTIAHERSLIRHDGRAISRQLMSIYFG